MLSDTIKQIIQNRPVIMSMEEVAFFFKVGKATIYRLIKKKELAAYKDDEDNWCILRDDLKKFCSKNSNL